MFMMNSKLIYSNRAIASASITLIYCGAVLMFSMAIILYFLNSHSKGHAMEKSSCAGDMVSSSILRG